MSVSKRVDRESSADKYYGAILALGLSRLLEVADMQRRIKSMLLLIQAVCACAYVRRMNCRFYM